MAILGGAGNPVGGSFTGTAEALELVGDNCYAYSGGLSVTDLDEHRLLSFTTGNYSSEVDFVFWRSTPDNDDVNYYVKMNGTQVLAWISILQEGRGNLVFPLIIPPYTQIEAFIDKVNSTTASIVGINITGSIYRARD